VVVEINAVIGPKALGRAYPVALQIQFHSDEWTALCGVLQAVVAEIDAAIGAKGVLSQECKSLVDNYATIILDLLEQHVSCCLLSQASTTVH